MPKFKRIGLDLKAETLDKLIFSYLSGYAPTRASVAESCSVSEMTAGKAARALIESGFMCERQYSSDGKRPCFHLFCNEGVRVLVIDLSSSAFKMSIVSPYGDIKFHTEYEYDTEISHADNLNVFFSRHSMNVKKSGYSFCAISVIYADIPVSRPGMSVYGFLPNISSEEHIANLVHSEFGKYPASHMTVSDAILNSLKFKAYGNTIDPCGLSYIFIGRHISAFHIHGDGSVTVCSPESLFPDIAGKLFTDHMLTEKNVSDAIFVQLAHFMGCAFSPSHIILESDILSPDDTTAELLWRKFALSGLNTPTVSFKDNSRPLRLVGASRKTLFSVIKRYVLPNNT
ncbi:MAG: hypothetical protein ACI3X1_05340 [Eubacteriales bacterium]